MKIYFTFSRFIKKQLGNLVVKLREIKKKQVKIKIFNAINILIWNFNLNVFFKFNHELYLAIPVIIMMYNSIIPKYKNAVSLNGLIQIYFNYIIVS